MPPLHSTLIRWYSNGQILELTWDSASGRLTAVTPIVEPVAVERIPWCSWGWLDLQVNGIAGTDFRDPELTESAWRAGLMALADRGVTAFLPTIFTASLGQTRAALRRLASLMASAGDGPCQALGIHLEGPFISDADGPRGMHPADHCRDPEEPLLLDWVEASNRSIRLITLAPERQGSVAFIKRCQSLGIATAIGHTAATEDQLAAAVAAGATLSTHWGNGCADLLARHHNPLHWQLAEDRLTVSLIVDGYHLPDLLVKIVTRVKGVERVVLISDLMPLAGMPSGRYDLGHCQVDVMADGSLRLVGTPRLAGASTDLGGSLARFQRITQCNLAEAINTVTHNPRRLLGLDSGGGVPKVGDWADLTLFLVEPDRLRVTGTVSTGGPPRFCEPPPG